MKISKNIWGKKVLIKKAFSLEIIKFSVDIFNECISEHAHTLRSKKKSSNGNPLTLCIIYIVS